MPSYIRTLTIFFNNTIEPHQVVQLRGGIISMIGDSTNEEVNTLYHNHIDNTFRFSYPLIQYKRISGKAAIVCLQEGCDQISTLLSANNTEITIGDALVNLEISKIIPQRFMFQTWNTQYAYRIRRWLALNPENYNTFLQLEGIAEKITLLEKILTANILAFAKGIGVHIENNIECKITSIVEPYLVNFKQNKLTAFDAEFKTNVFLPNYIGLGKSSSIGFGIVSSKKDNK
jgi:CRISPR/Cas system endoribonuclease Cas6 (RAMP superfamily)